MALVVRIGSYKALDVPDALGRNWHGWFPRMTETEAYEAGRGAWKLGPRADTETFALVVAGTGDPHRTVLAVIEIDALTGPAPDGRRSFTGRVLEPGHPVRDTYLGRPAPLETVSRNPVGYVDLPEEEPYRIRACACGCGTQTRRDFAPGHDQKAIHDRIRRHFDGSTVEFLHWIDQHGPGAEAAAGELPSA
ncbi:hypothetical protein H7X46_00285 [Pseudonocardia sp. C8]|uniref:hypothetical protein n=1 Tax=Pseudonocardia sp. C8 TaxID=2762759 RepID=UPI001642A690|nr:hypothetical protein [Pseudonocardia sp. C8]MBC3189507.1 hypothetical protein [Pseudonocardia sp. C8]